MWDTIIIQPLVNVILLINSLVHSFRRFNNFIHDPDSPADPSFDG